MLMAESGQRRSARLVALEQQKHEKAANVVSTNVEEETGNARSIGRKRSRRKKVRDVYESYEYNASFNRPGDFGTPWHRRWDGVRATQEQLENDVGITEREWNRGSSSRPRGRKETEHPESSDEQRRYTYYRHGSVSDEPLIRMVVDTQKQLIYNNKGMDYRESMSRFVKDAGPVAKIIAEKRCLEYSVKAHARKTYERERANTFNSNASSMHPFFNFSSHHTFSVNSSTATAPISWNPASSSLEDPYSIVLPTFVVDPASSSQMNNSTPGSSDDMVLGDFGCKLETDKLLTMFSQIGTPEFLNNSSNMASSSKRETRRDLDPAHTFAGI